MPFRCTLMTASHSSSVMFVSMRSRRMPALFTSTSRPPKVSTAVLISRCAPCQSETSSPFDTASPPMALISSTTSWAGPVDAPVPSISPPRSLTTTLAPCSASIKACSRPMPRPAPVTMHTRPSHIPATAASPVQRTVSSWWMRVYPAPTEWKAGRSKFPGGPGHDRPDAFREPDERRRRAHVDHREGPAAAVDDHVRCGSRPDPRS